MTDGEQLMQLINTTATKLPDVVFLDLNMPRKNGLECVREIKLNAQLKHVPVVVISTSFDDKVIQELFIIGAHHYIRKPAEFPLLKKVIHRALRSVAEENYSKKDFILWGKAHDENESP